MKKALITGISGQDGSYLAELLFDQGYEVHGMVRRVAIEDPEHRLSHIVHLLDRIKVHTASVESYPGTFAVIERVRPDECYHLAAQSFVSYGFEEEFATFETNISGTQNVLAALHRVVPECRFYFAGSSEMFGKVQTAPQNEETPLRPRNPYGITKVTGYHLTRNYRDSFGMHASSGILYNHESPRRGFEFVTRKITSGAAAIACGRRRKLRLGNLEARRDWGFAGDYVRAMWLMLQQPCGDDFVIASGELHTVRNVLEIAFRRVGLKWEDHVEIDPALVRPTESVPLMGDASKARRILDWSPSVTFEELITLMTDADLARERGRSRARR